MASANWWAAILAGGSGTRFWPLSTARTPKQFLPLAGDRPLLAQTVTRIGGLVPPERIIVVTGHPLVRATRELLPDIPPDNVLGEPRSASTAPALAWATVYASEQDSDACVLSLHADWHVGDDDAFRTAAARALEVAARHDVLVTVGIVPTRPDVGYGYIVPGAELEGEARRVEEFVEKPDATRAAQLIARGGLWNSGLFAWTAARFGAETEAVATEIAPHMARLIRGDVAGFFQAVTPIAVDVSHFERSARVAVVPGQFPWDDVGTWAALARVRSTDTAGNVVVGDGVLLGAQDCIIWTDHHPVVLDGVSNLVVVQAHGVTLITTRERAADLKKVLETLPDHIREIGE